jgi:2-C-methyl-D-erythritol 4-phosphate cytidylyltransferase/2-C-methyl-D-erythritol 2,4-cyclodiphosphate synthase
MSTAAVIVAAGRGIRAGGGLPKQWRTLKGKTLVAHTIESFRAAPVVGPVCLVLHPDDMLLADGYEGHGDVIVASGGATRALSVRAGLEALAALAPDKVLIHDVARPLVSQTLMASVDAALASADGAAPALPLTDAIWRVTDGRIVGIENRELLRRAQTPQGFRFSSILAAHRNHGADAADDVEVALAAGLDVVTVPGDERNIKITGPDDFTRAERLLEGELDVRSGTGFDVHRFGPGNHVMLCGIKIPHEFGLEGHSDADVALHAITDAIYGALADGDIGRHFPPSDPMWAGTDSSVFLEHAAARAANRGYRIANLDCTLICERPKIATHAEEMVRSVSRIVGVGPGRVSVKATTSERLGFTGRGEGIAALASVMLVAG